MQPYRLTRYLQPLLKRKFATDRPSFVQYYESLRKWCDFSFFMHYFQVNTPLSRQYKICLT